MYIMGLVHGLFSGTDSPAGWAQWYYWISGGSLLFLTMYRILNTLAEKSAPRPKPKPAAQPARPMPQPRPMGLQQLAAPQTNPAVPQSAPVAQLQHAATQPRPAQSSQEQLHN
jgi:hypothetical protein